MKKLIPAISMTLLGAALLGTSTYAWFSANKTVTATGMNLQAKADSSLLISNASDGTFSNTMSFENDVAGAHTYLTPTRATFEDGSYTFKKLNTAGVKLVNPPDGSFAVPSGHEESEYFEATELDNFHDSCFLKFEAPNGESGAPTQDIAFKATMTSQGTEDIYKAFRVSVVDPDANDGAGAVLYTFKFTSLGTEVVAQSGEPAEDVTFTLTANVAKEIEVYAWLDGDDSSCINSEAIDGAAYTVMLSFYIPQNIA